MLIRAETPADRPAVLHVVRRAFGSPAGGEPVEAGLLRALFEDPGYLAHLSLLAEQDGAVIGHVICTRGWIGTVPALGLGPLAVDPARQGTGVGSALMGGVIAAARSAGERIICLLGSPEYYARFGFAEARGLGIEAPDPRWGEHFMALELSGGPAPAGRFRYAAPFEDL